METPPVGQRMGIEIFEEIKEIKETRKQIINFLTYHHT